MKCHNKYGNALLNTALLAQRLLKNSKELSRFLNKKNLNKVKTNLNWADLSIWCNRPTLAKE